jgi:hypothetical protein
LDADRGFAYDLENRPLAIVVNGASTALQLMDYGPDGERVKKARSDGSSTTWYMGGEAELTVDTLNPAGAFTTLDLSRFDSASLMRNTSHQGERLWQKYTMMSLDVRQCGLH